VVDREADLERMRVALLAAMVEAEPRTLPSVCRELRAVDAELVALAPSVSAGQALVDELRAQRARRRPAS
jgi:hypothetical protein